MNKHVKQYALTAAVILGMSGNTAYASIRSEGTKIIIDGTVEQKLQDLNVGIQVIGPYDSAINDMKDALDKNFSSPASLDKTYYIEVLTGADGKYSFAVPDIVPGKFYGIAVREPDSELITETMYIADKAMIASVLNQINAAKSGLDIKAVFDNEQYHDMLIENYKIFHEITSEASKQKVYELIYSEKGNGFASLGELEKSIQSSSAVVRTAEEADVNKAVSYAKYIALDQADKKLFDRYDAGDSQVKKEIIKRVMNQKPETEQAYIARFEESCFLQSIKDEKYAGNLSAVLKDYAGKFGFDLSKYGRVETEVNKKLIGKDFQALSEFKTALDDAIAKAGTSSSSPSGGGSGGGSGQSNPMVNVPEQNTAVVNSTNFDDLAGVAWARDAIESLADKGIIAGKGERIFAPNDYITREEFIKIVVCAFGLEDDGAEASFADLDKNAWSYRYVAAGVKAGLIKGIDETRFGVGMEITRQDIAAILYRYFQSVEKEMQTNNTLFADDDMISEYAKEAVYALKAEGILSGTGKNHFEPRRNATRAEAAKVIASVLGI